MKQLSGLLLLFLVLVGCGRGERIYLSDVTKPATLTLTPPTEKDGQVNYLKLRIKGRLDGSAQIWATGLPTNTVGQRFAIVRTGNYRQTNCVVRYLPTSVRSGRVTIQYSFH